MLKVSPVSTHRIAMNFANVVVSPHHRAGETFQNDAESSGCDIKGTGLKPDTIRVRNPKTGGEEAESPRAADCVASGARTTARVRKETVCLEN
jgi:hypothetical protein